MGVGEEGKGWFGVRGLEKKVDQRIRCQSPGRIGERREPVEPGDRRLISLMDRYLAFLFSSLEES